jgi:PST family polysaccharide transporter
MTESSTNEALVKATIQGTMWAYLATYSGKLLVFASTVILARLLTQEDFGLAGYALIVISFLDVLNDLGIGSAIIYYRDDPKILNTAFWLNLLAGIGLFALTWLVAPLAGLFFKNPEALPLTRVLGLTFPITALGNIHASLLLKNMTFKRKFVPDVTKAVGKGIISIVLALYGFGAWSLVLGQVGGTAVAVIAYWWAYPWRPKWQFDRAAARPLLSYGTNIVSVDALGTLINQADYLLIGRILGAAALGVYTLAFRIPELLVKQFVTIAGQVIFPAYAKMRTEPGMLSRGFLVTMRYMTTITAPVALGLAAVSGPLVLTLFTDKWADAIPVMAAISIYTLIRALTFNIGHVYKAQGRPEILTRLSLIKVVVLVPALWWAATVPGTTTAVAWMQVFMSFLFAALNIYVAALLLATPFRKIAAAFAPGLIGGIIMAGCVLGVLQLMQNTSSLWQLMGGVLVGIVTYALFLWIFQRDLLKEAESNLRPMLNKKASTRVIEEL